MFKKFILTLKILVLFQSLSVGSPPKVELPSSQSSQRSSSSYTETLDSFDGNSNSLDIQLPVQDVKTGCQIFVMDPGQGNFIIVKNYDHKTIAIIDAGSSTSGMNFKKFYTENETLLNNIFESDFTINCIFITHTDRDHYNFFKESEESRKDNFVENFWKYKISKNCIIVIGGGITDDTITTLKNFSSAIYRIVLKKDSCVYYDKSGDMAKSCCLDDILNAVNTAFSNNSNYQFKILDTSNGYKDKDSKNTQSLLILLQGNGGNILFTGDATLSTINAVKDHKELNCVNFLVIPHHGAKTAGSPEVSKTVILEAGENFIGACVSANPAQTSKRYNHPQKESIPKMSNPGANYKHKRPIVVYDGKKLKKWYTRRKLFEPGLLAGKVLWMKLENGLSIFDNKEYAIHYSEDSLPSATDYFIPQTIILNKKTYTTYTYLQNFEGLILAENEEILKDHFEKLFNSNTASVFKFKKHFGKHLSEECQKKLGFLEEKQKERLGYFIPDDAMEEISLNSSFEELITEDINDLIAGILPNYYLQDVLGDGNCGIWALLQTLNPEKEYNDKGNLTDNDKFKMISFRNLASEIAKGNGAAETTVNRIKFFEKDGKNEMPKDVSVDQDRYIATDDFSFFSQLLGCPITVIRSDGICEEYGQEEMNRGNTLYIYFDVSAHHYQALLKNQTE